MMIFAADLFCGAGGTSTGFLKAAEELGLKVELIAVNHWTMAIATHKLNHPGVRHFNTDLSELDPRQVVPGGKLRLLIASPECTHFSRARGGRPMSKQSRASVKYVLRWVTALEVDDVLIENVPEFMDWGPLHRKGAHIDQPIKNRKGEYFHRFVRKMEEHGYQVRWQILNAADYGDPTTRKRLFIIARRKETVRFPEATHRAKAVEMFGTYPTWRPAREIIDWTIKGESIFKRKRPLSPNTMRRIAAGLQKFGGKAFVIGQQSKAAPRSVDDPMPTVAGRGAIGFVEPFIISQFSNGAPKSIDDPLGTITSTSRGIGLVQPFLVEYHGGKNGDKRTRSLNEPLPTQDTNNRFGLVEPFIMAVNHGKDDKRSYSLNEPMPTVTSVDAWALIEPFIVMMNGTKEDQLNRSQRPVSEPLPTVTASRHLGLIEPFLVEYHGTGTVASVDEPLKTQTGKDRFGLAEPKVVQDAEGRQYALDILFRMLKPHELAAAMSFPKDYRFEGNREEVVKQIGNAVPVELAKALCRELLR